MVSGVRSLFPDFRPPCPDLRPPFPTYDSISLLWTLAALLLLHHSVWLAARRQRLSTCPHLAHDAAQAEGSPVVVLCRARCAGCPLDALEEAATR